MNVKHRSPPNDTSGTSEVENLDGVEDTVGDDVAPHDTSEDVHKYSFDLGVREKAQAYIGAQPSNSAKRPCIHSYHSRRFERLL